MLWNFFCQICILVLQRKNMEHELFIIKPSLRQYYGRTVKKDTEFDEYTEDKTVHQILKDLVLTTEITRDDISDV